MEAIGRLAEAGHRAEYSSRPAHSSEVPLMFFRGREARPGPRV